MSGFRNHLKDCPRDLEIRAEQESQATTCDVTRKNVETRFDLDSPAIIHPIRIEGMTVIMPEAWRDDDDD